MNRLLEDALPTEYGRLLQKAIKSHKPRLYSPHQAAKYMEIAPAMLYRYLRGELNPSPETAEKIGIALGMDLTVVRRLIPNRKRPGPAPSDPDKFADDIADRVLKRIGSALPARGRLNPDDPLLEPKDLLFNEIGEVNDPATLEAIRRVLEEFRGGRRPDDAR